jgi:hypothetical protein
MGKGVRYNSVEELLANASEDVRASYNLTEERKRYFEWKNAAPSPPKQRGPNKTETRFETDHLKPMLHVGSIIKYDFEHVTLKLFDKLEEKTARATRYTPDWRVVLPGGATRFYEVKGAYAWEGALDKLKAAAKLFPEYGFVLARWEGGRWTLIPVRP